MFEFSFKDKMKETIHNYFSRQRNVLDTDVGEGSFVKLCIHGWRFQSRHSYQTVLWKSDSTASDFS